MESTDIQRRSQTSHIASCNGVVSHGAKIGGLWALLITYAKTDAELQSLHAVWHFTCVLSLWIKIKKIYVQMNKTD